jgi:hypothetical protein
MEYGRLNKMNDNSAGEVIIGKQRTARLAWLNCRSRLNSPLATAKP